MKQINEFLNEALGSRLEKQISEYPELAKIQDVLTSDEYSSLGFTPVNLKNTGRVNELMYAVDDMLPFRTTPELKQWAMSSKNALEQAKAELEEFATEEGFKPTGSKGNEIFSVNITVNPRQINMTLWSSKTSQINVSISQTYSAIGAGMSKKADIQLLKKFLDWLSEKLK